MLQLLETETRKIERALQTLDDDVGTIGRLASLLIEFELVAGLLKSTGFTHRTDEKTYRLLESEEIFHIEDGFVQIGRAHV